MGIHAMSEEKDRALDLMTIPEESWPEREALFRIMFNALMNELMRRDGVTVKEEAFKGLSQPTVLMAISDLAASLVGFATKADGEYGSGDCLEMADEVVNEIRRTLIIIIGTPPSRVH
jgi:hypothetical protein